MTDDDAKTTGFSSSQVSDGGIPNVKVVSPGRLLTVDQAERLKSEILSAFERSDVVSMALSNVERIDLAGVHLLYGAKREADKQGKTFRLTGALQKEAAAMLVTSGFCPSVPGDASELDTLLLEFEPRTARPGAGDNRES